MKRTFPIQSLLMLLLSLSVIIALLYIISHNLALQYPPLPKNVKTGVSDSVYFNAEFHFAVRLPNASWRFSKIIEAPTVSLVDDHEKIWPQVTWITTMDCKNAHQALAEVRAGILKWPNEPETREIANTLLYEFITMYEKNNRMEILQPVAGPAHRILQGHYFVVKLPNEMKECVPIWLVALLPRSPYIYIVFAKLNERDYNSLRPQVEKVVSGFTPLPRIVRD